MDDSRSTSAAAPRHLTTRRGFIAAASLGTLSLYGAWVLLGATSLGVGGERADGHGAAASGGHGGHGAPSGPGVAEFRRLTDEFIARYRQPDGSVRPLRTSGATAPPSAAHDAAASDHGAHAGHGAAPVTPVPAPVSGASGPIDIYIAAAQWAFEPAVLRLEAGTPYRFRMMAVDASHGAALQLGSASHVIRLRRGALVERDLTFPQAGEYLLYCTLFCGIGHDRMAGRIIVT